MPQLPELADTKIPLYAPMTSSAKFVCFDCRVCFHKARAHSERDQHECPNCKKVMMYAGSAFRAPKRRDVRAWATLEVLIRDGVRFHYYGGNDQVPKNANEAKKVRSARKRKSQYARRNSAGKRVLMNGPGDYYSHTYTVPV